MKLRLFYLILSCSGIALASGSSTPIESPSPTAPYETPTLLPQPAGLLSQGLFLAEEESLPKGLLTSHDFLFALEKMESYFEQVAKPCGLADFLTLLAPFFQLERGEVNYPLTIILQNLRDIPLPTPSFTTSESFLATAHRDFFSSTEYLSNTEYFLLESLCSMIACWYASRTLPPLVITLEKSATREEVYLLTKCILALWLRTNHCSLIPGDDLRSRITTLKKNHEELERSLETCKMFLGQDIPTLEDQRPVSSSAGPLSYWGRDFQERFFVTLGWRFGWELGRAFEKLALPMPKEQAHPLDRTVFAFAGAYWGRRFSLSTSGQNFPNHPHQTMKDFGEAEQQGFEQLLGHYSLGSEVFTKKIGAIVGERFFAKGGVALCAEALRAFYEGLSAAPPFNRNFESGLLQASCPCAAEYQKEEIDLAHAWQGELCLVAETFSTIDGVSLATDTSSLSNISLFSRMRNFFRRHLH